MKVCSTIHSPACSMMGYATVEYSHTKYHGTGHLMVRLMEYPIGCNTGLWNVYHETTNEIMYHDMSQKALSFHDVLRHGVMACPMAPHGIPRVSMGHTTGQNTHPSPIIITHHGTSHEEISWDVMVSHTYIP